MHVELLRTTTTDGVRLHAALRRADVPPLNRGPVDVWLLVHGTGANFYGSSLLGYLADGMAERGATALLANTRGRDLAYADFAAGEPRRLGAAYERVDDARHDLSAWLDLLRQRGYSRPGLCGHSLGAIKAVYVLAREPLDVARLVAVSPARLSHDYFLACPQSETFRQTLEQAQRLVEEGRPGELMEVEFPIPYLVTAAGYVDKYGPGERFNVLQYLDRLPCPSLFVFGEKEVNSHAAFRGLPEDIQAAAAENVQVKVVPAADHVYSSTQSELLRVILQWTG